MNQRQGNQEKHVQLPKQANQPRQVNQPAQSNNARQPNLPGHPNHPSHPNQTVVRRVIRKTFDGEPIIPIKMNPAEYEAGCLEWHNKYRAKHGTPPLTLNANLTKIAAAWAEYLAKENKMEHNMEHKYGENIYFSSGQEVSTERPVEMWYSEIKMYDFKKSEFRPETGHFTQLIWHDCKEVGIGLAMRGEAVWVVANYNPPGNVVGKFKENVPLPISK